MNEFSLSAALNCCACVWVCASVCGDGDGGQLYLIICLSPFLPQEIAFPDVGFDMEDGGVRGLFSPHLAHSFSHTPSVFIQSCHFCF